MIGRITEASPEEMSMEMRKLNGNLLAVGASLVLLSGTALAQQAQTPEAAGQALQPAEAVSEGAPVYFSPTAVRQIQQQLNEAGYAPGNVDGAWGPETADALANFQRDQGLDPTGTLTFETVGALGLGDLISAEPGATAGAGATGQPGQVPTAGTAVEQEETEQETPRQQ